MSGGLIFIVGVITLLLFATAVSMIRQGLSPVEWFKAMKPSDRKGIATGIFICLAIVVALGLTGCSGASMYAGLDQTFKQSPQCVDGGSDDRVTSNIGFKGWHTLADDVTLYAKYTHHSCAFSPDRNSYDAVGAGVEYKFW